MLYNGKDEYPDHEVLKLSSMFKDLEDSSLANLELKVNVYNINKGRNKEFAKRSKSLEDYEYFIYLIRENSKADVSLDDAIELAVRDCVRQGVLEEFLTEHGSEVNNMLFHEWNLDEAKEVWREDGRHEGIAIGEARGVEKGVAIGEARGMEKAAMRVRRNCLRFWKAGFLWLRLGGGWGCNITSQSPFCSLRPAVQRMRPLYSVFYCQAVRL